jgi:hypothetical protein
MTMDNHRTRELIEHRIAQANAVIQALADHGRHAFRSERYDVVGYFFIDSVMQGWWVDFVTGMKVEAGCGPNLYHDPERGLMTALLDYIRTGKAIDASWLDARWGYGEEMEAVREALEGNDAVQG